ncbi:hypothetical protein ACLK2A_11345 [Escherichia coli]
MTSAVGCDADASSPTYLHAASGKQTSSVGRSGAHAASGNRTRKQAYKPAEHLDTPGEQPVWKAIR